MSEASPSGKSFLTRSVKASQRGKNVFLMLASFAKIELGHPEAQWPAHFGVRSPKDSIDRVDVLQNLADRETDPKRKQFLLEHKMVRINSRDRSFGMNSLLS